MDIHEKERLRHRKQYLICDQEIICPFLHHVYKLDNEYSLYAHIDLIVTKASQNGTTVFVLGDILDWEFPEKSNQDIVNDLLIPEFSALLEKTSRYAGRFVLIHIHSGVIKLMHDATACRKIYYYSGNSFFVASQPHLLARVAGINKTTDTEKLKFYRSAAYKFLNNANIGDLTSYDEVFQLLPNHYLNLNDLSKTRYWAKNIRCDLTLNETADICARMLKGYMHSISNRYPMMLPVTAGKDSRTLLSATRDISDKVYYYINKENRLSRDSLDITVPDKLITGLGLPFHIVDPYIEIDPDFIEVYYDNNPDATEFYLPLIYNYYVNFQDKVNLPGNFVASAYDMYGSYIKEISPKILALLNYVNQYGFAVDYYQRWIENSQEFCKQNNINALMLFYWEERLANWGTQVQIDKDIAQEDLIPYNSRQLIHYFFSVKPDHIDRPDFFFFKKIIGILWCELLITPTNPSTKNKVSKFIYRMGLLEMIRKSRYFYQIRLKSYFISHHKNPSRIKF
jgi:hypothetical protein